MGDGSQGIIPSKILTWIPPGGHRWQGPTCCQMFELKPRDDNIVEYIQQTPPVHCDSGRFFDFRDQADYTGCSLTMLRIWEGLVCPKKTKNFSAKLYHYICHYTDRFNSRSCNIVWIDIMM